MVNKTDNCIVVLTVNNHAGVMSHITGLFARRAFNLEGIMCGTVGDGSISRIYLMVKKDNSLEQIIKQVQKLYDVISVSVCEDCDTSVFGRLDQLVGSSMQ